MTGTGTGPGPETFSGGGELWALGGRGHRGGAEVGCLPLQTDREVRGGGAVTYLDRPPEGERSDLGQQATLPNAHHD